jgi:hypothetical protein
MEKLSTNKNHSYKHIYRKITNYTPTWSLKDSTPPFSTCLFKYTDRVPISTLKGIYLKQLSVAMPAIAYNKQDMSIKT